MATILSRLAAASRLMLFDKRGTGMSDRVADVATLETRMDDVRAVMDEARSPRAAMMGISEGAPMSLLFAATHPTGGPNGYPYHVSRIRGEVRVRVHGHWRLRWRLLFRED